MQQRAAMHRSRAGRRALPPSCGVAARAIAAAILLAGCEGPQSALAPGGREASEIADLFWGMTIGGAVIWVAVVALAIYAVYGSRGTLTPRQGRLLIIGGGAVFPIVVLAGLLAYGLSMLPRLLAPPPDDAIRIHVTGYQWWWRVRYLRDDGPPVELANELRFPAGTPVELHLDSPDVIHSFWIPSLAGKMDMIPGRSTRLLIHPAEPGVYRGVCAEYCGESHAWMLFFAVVEEPAAFDRWLAAQAEPAAPPEGALATRGAEVFLASGCGACHAVRGTPADGVIGPDLTHVGSRLSLGAGLLDNDPAAFRRWIAETAELKPGVHMPAFGALPPDDLEALAVYLEGLQ